MDKKDLIIEENKIEEIIEETGETIDETVEGTIDENTVENAEEPTPKKKKKKSGIVYKLVMLICIGVFLFAGYNLYKIQHEYAEIEEYYEDIVEEYVEVDEDGTISYVDLDRLIENNSDVKGWIYIEDTTVSYPLLQGPNNDYYLYLNYDEEYSGAGSIYIDSANAGDLSDDHTIIYGHNMKNNSMLGRMSDFESQAHRDAHPNVYILTPDGVWNKYEIFGFYRADVSDGTFNIFTDNPDSMTRYINLVAEKNCYDNLNLPRDGEKIITLSTCTEDLDDNCRNVLHARFVGTVESIE